MPPDIKVNGAIGRALLPLELAGGEDDDGGSAGVGDGGARRERCSPNAAMPGR